MYLTRSPSPVNVVLIQKPDIYTIASAPTIRGLVLLYSGESQYIFGTVHTIRESDYFWDSARN